MATKGTARQQILGESPLLHAGLDIFEMAAPFTDCHIQIGGETGTGKELAARFVHEMSGLKGPFFAFNCGAVSEDLAESQLFGHVRGAFTGALQDRPGYFERAKGGTLLLDEIGDASPKIQLLILRVLQEKLIERVGDKETRAVDVRIITATHRNLEELCKAGKFREDLLYRLGQTKVDLPPLRERGQDSVILAREFARCLNPTKSLSKDAEDLILRYTWPGNIRELQGMIKSARIFPGDIITSDKLMRYIGPKTLTMPAQAHVEESLDRQKKPTIQEQSRIAHESRSSSPIREKDETASQEEQQNKDKPHSGWSKPEQSESPKESNQEKSRKERIIEVIGRLGKATPPDIRTATSVSRSTLLRELNDLVSTGVINRVSKSNYTYYVHADASQESLPKENPLPESLPHKDDAGVIATLESAPQENALQATTPREIIEPRETAPRTIVLHNEAQVVIVPQETAPPEDAAQVSTPLESVPQDSVPRESWPRVIMLQESVLPEDDPRVMVLQQDGSSAIVPLEYLTRAAAPKAIARQGQNSQVSLPSVYWVLTANKDAPRVLVLHNDELSFVPLEFPKRNDPQRKSARQEPSHQESTLQQNVPGDAASGNVTQLNFIPPEVPRQNETPRTSLPRENPCGESTPRAETPLMQRQADIIQMVEKVGRASRQQVAESLDIPIRTTSRDLLKLLSLGALVPDGRRGNAAGYLLPTMDATISGKTQTKRILEAIRRHGRVPTADTSCPPVPAPLDLKRKLKTRQANIICQVVQNGGITRGQVVQTFGISGRTASREFAALLALGALVPDGQRGNAAGYVLPAASKSNSPPKVDPIDGDTEPEEIEPVYLNRVSGKDDS